METKKCKALLKAIDCGSFLHAGESLGYSQSGITQMMNSLERELGFAVLVRTNKGVFLTEEGKRIAPLLRELVRLDERLEQECALITGVERGTVTVGCFISVAIQWLPKMIYQFKQQYPGIHVEMLEEGSAEALESWLHEGRIDLAIYSLDLDGPFDCIPLQRDELMAVLPQGHPLCAYTAVPLSAFAEEPFLMYKLPSGAYDADIYTAFRKAKIHPKIEFSSNFDFTIISMVEHNLGVSVLPSFILDGHTQNIVTRPLMPPVNRTLGIAVRSLADASPAVKRFISCAKHVLEP